MAINEKLIHFKTKANFTALLEAGNILDTSIVYIQDTKEIYTHGTIYGTGSSQSDEVAISDGVEPKEAEIWIDTSEKPEAAISIEDAPKDGNQYVRQDGEWAQISAGEVCRITLESNQGEGDASSLLGVSVQVVNTDNEELYLDTTWQGTELSCIIPPGNEYKIVCGDLENYQKPSDKTFVAAAFINRQTSMVYNTELVSVTLSSNDDASVVGQKVTINGIEHTYAGIPVTQKVAFGTVYSIVCDAKAHYDTPTSITDRTAFQVSYVVNLMYNYHPGTTSPSNGVYIKDTEGYYHTSDAWDGTYTADCVAVITSNRHFGIALTESDGKRSINDTSEAMLEVYMTAISDESSAKADYDGRTNTSWIMRINSDTSYAAGWCKAYTFPSGKNGFLPSLGEMWAAYCNKSAVDAALTKAGGSALTSDYYWTSTFWGLNGSMRCCWILRWSDGNVTYFHLNYGHKVRAFCSL